MLYKSSTNKLRFSHKNMNGNKVKKGARENTCGSVPCVQFRHEENHTDVECFTNAIFPPLALTMQPTHLHEIKVLELSQVFYHLRAEGAFTTLAPRPTR